MAEPRREGERTEQPNTPELPKRIGRISREQIEMIARLMDEAIAQPGLRVTAAAFPGDESVFVGTSTDPKMPVTNFVELPTPAKNTTAP